MAHPPIYLTVKNKLIGHGVDRTSDGLRTLNDKHLFLLFVELERARRAMSFDMVMEVIDAMDIYLASIGKRHVVVFAYMYLRFSELTPRCVEVPEIRHDGTSPRTEIFERPISDEARLIGLWAKVKFDQFGDHFLAHVYR